VNRLLVAVAILCALATAISTFALYQVLKVDRSESAGIGMDLICAPYEMDGRVALVCYRHQAQAAQRAEDE